MGNSWAGIAHFLPGRTDNSIKNHFYSCLKKMYKQSKGSEGTREQLKKNYKILSEKIVKSLEGKVSGS